MNNFVLMFEHDGIIEHIEGNMAHVRISSESACAACHAKGACSAADQSEKYLDIPLGGTEYKKGELVRVEVARHLGFKAVALGYIYPFIILLAALVILTEAGIGELKAGVIALLSLPPYYLVLYLARNRIEKKFTFSIHKTSVMQ
jgi:sigma-E factor negative regulatory protein RseC